MGFFDSMRDEECGFALHADGTWRCLPGTDSVGGNYAAGCSDPLINVLADSTTRYVSPGDAGRRVFKRGAVYTEPSMYYKSFPAGTCEATPTKPLFTGYVLVRVGAEIPASDFQIGERKRTP